MIIVKRINNFSTGCFARCYKEKNVAFYNNDNRDAEAVLHPYTHLLQHSQSVPLEINRAKGIYVYDKFGKPYIEGVSSLWCTSLGYGNEEIIEVATQAMRDLSFTHIFGGKTHENVILLAEKIKELVPFDASKVFFASSGSEANDTQIKLLWYYNNAIGRTQKKKIISRYRGYHGVTLASASLTGLPTLHQDFDLPIQQIYHTDCPHYYTEAQEGEDETAFSQRMAESLEKLIIEQDPDTIAGFIAEPIMGAGGVIMPPKGYFQAITAILRKYDITFIDDEVICGFGRLGTWFGSQYYDYTPDTMSLAKAMTSAYLPLSAVTISEPFYKAFLDQSKKIGTFGHGTTYSGHPVCAATALKVIEIYQRDNVVEKVAQKSHHFYNRIRRLHDHPFVGDARATGLLGAIELVRDKKMRQKFEPQHKIAIQLVHFAEKRGLIVRAVYGDVIGFCPPLIINETEIDEMFDIMEKALDDLNVYVKQEIL